MYMMGIGMVSIIRVKNNTDKLIENIDLVYGSDSKVLNLKGIKSKENKQTFED